LYMGRDGQPVSQQTLLHCPNGIVSTRLADLRTRKPCVQWPRRSQTGQMSVSQRMTALPRRRPLRDLLIWVRSEQELSLRDSIQQVVQAHRQFAPRAAVLQSLRRGRRRGSWSSEMPVARASWKPASEWNTGRSLGGRFTPVVCSPANAWGKVVKQRAIADV